MIVSTSKLRSTQSNKAGLTPHYMPAEFVAYIIPNGPSLTINSSLLSIIHYVFSSVKASNVIDTRTYAYIHTFVKERWVLMIVGF